MLRMVRFGVVDSMDRDVRSIALQNLVNNQPSPEFMSPQSETLLEEVSPMGRRPLHPYHFKLTTFFMFLPHRKTN